MLTIGNCRHVFKKPSTVQWYGCFQCTSTNTVWKALGRRFNSHQQYRNCFAQDPSLFTKLRLHRTEVQRVNEHVLISLPGEMHSNDEQDTFFAKHTGHLCRRLNQAADPTIFVKVGCDVLITGKAPSYLVACPCRHYEEPMRPCSHAIAVIKVASTLVFFFSIYLKAFSTTTNTAWEWLFWDTAPSSTNYSKSS